MPIFIAGVFLYSHFKMSEQKAAAASVMSSLPKSVTSHNANNSNSAEEASHTAVSLEPLPSKA